MFDFSMTQFMRDCFVIVGGIGVVSGIIMGALIFTYKRQQVCTTFTSFVSSQKNNPVLRYFIPSVGLFFIIYGCKLVVIKLVLALIYAFVMVCAFNRQEK